MTDDRSEGARRARRQPYGVHVYSALSLVLRHITYMSRYRIVRGAGEFACHGFELSAIADNELAHGVGYG